MTLRTAIRQLNNLYNEKYITLTMLSSSMARLIARADKEEIKIIEDMMEKITKRG